MTSKNKRVRVTVDNQGVAEVTMVRAEKMNAIDIDMFQGLMGAIDQLRSDAQTRVVVLHGEGRAFCAGLDVGLFQQMTSGRIIEALGDILERKHGLANGPQQIAWGWRELSVPVIAAVHGMAFGGGLQIALGTDIRCVHPDTQLAVMEIKWGLVPDMAGCVCCSVNSFGPMSHASLHLPDVSSPALKPLHWALQPAFPRTPLEEALKLASQIARRSPDAIRAGKATPEQGLTRRCRAGVVMAETQEQLQLIGSTNQREARAGQIAETGAQVRLRCKPDQFPGLKITASFQPFEDIS